MGKIIICFQKDDTASIAGRLDDFLSNRFGEANITLGVEKLVKIGEDYSDSIEDRVKASDAFILLIGDRWLTGDWAANPNDYNAIAVNAAINNRKRIIPVLVNNAVFPASSLPESFASLARRMPTTLREEQFRADAAALADSIQEFVAPAPPPTPQPPPVAPAPAAPAPITPAPPSAIEIPTLPAVPSNSNRNQQIIVLERHIGEIENQIAFIDKKLAKCTQNKIVAGVVAVIGLFLVAVLVGIAVLIAAAVMYSNAAKEEKQLQEERLHRQNDLLAVKQELRQLQLQV